MSKCFKCGSENNVIKHHTSYNPEVILDCCRSCHTKIHKRVRKEGYCKYSVKEISILSKKSYNKRNHSNHKYKKNYISIDYTEQMMEHVRFHEQIFYDKNIGTISYTSRFEGTGNKRLWIEEI